MDKAYSNSMEKLTSNMEKLTGSISDGFALLQRMIGILFLTITALFLILLLFDD